MITHSAYAWLGWRDSPCRLAPTFYLPQATRKQGCRGVSLALPFESRFTKTLEKALDQKT